MLEIENKAVRIGVMAGLGVVILLGVFLVVRAFWPEKISSGRWQRPPRTPSVVKPTPAPVTPPVQP